MPNDSNLCPVCTACDNGSHADPAYDLMGCGCPCHGTPLHVDLNWLLEGLPLATRRVYEA